MTKLEEFNQLFPLRARLRLLAIDKKDLDPEITLSEAETKERVQLSHQEIKALNALGLFEGKDKISTDETRLLIELGYYRDDAGGLISIDKPPVVTENCPRCLARQQVLTKILQLAQGELGTVIDLPSQKKISKAVTAKQVLELVGEGLSHREVAARLGTSHATVTRLVHLARATEPK